MYQRINICRVQPGRHCNLLFSVWIGGGTREETCKKVGTMHAHKGACDVLTVGGIIPEEIFALGFLGFRISRSKHRLQSVRMEPGIIYLGGKSHGCGSEILHLLQMQVKTLGLGSELCHVDFTASRMGGYEIWYELLFQPKGRIDPAEES